MFIFTDTLLDAGARAINQADKNPYLQVAYLLV